ncbi:Uncharacterised protein [Mycobacterium tuberculosis]|uniref:Uncharacterized protein n=2 Tax=Mycobacterium tuberculosis TaxID=1773 RepID=A0A655F7I2_MYCTX|nr:Uncharacterised protein [Mycobacterium tuberculosis]CKR82595.1 Uncharacterised protein [Mycobacterium tuberculosis]CKT71023.1 Uncharacterised protein [Mycobacterium tuberculosis]CKU47991.1 Uncharacterised protein [Mycobacterium tuberculosis]CNV53351.1 Uncharacterised protein [Mycobacterium tuberculosis]
MRSDVAGRTDDELAGVGIQRDRFPRKSSPLQPGYMACARPVYDLILPVGTVGCSQHMPHGQLCGHRIVEIDYAAPDFRML